VSGSLYFKLSVMMFLQYAVWGAWAPVLAARLLGPLKMSGKQTGWIYGTLPLACIISPLIAGQLTDQWIAAERFLGIAHIIGAVLMLIAAYRQKFGALLLLMGLYSLCYAATLPLVNSLMFFQLGQQYASKAEVSQASTKIFIWAPVAWAIVGWLLSGIRRISGTSLQGRDCLFLAAGISLLMGVYCFFLPHTPPAKADIVPFVEALSLLAKPNVLVFLIISLVVATQLQFYFLGTAHFLTDIGIRTRNIPAAMAIAQIAQTIATALLLGRMLDVGFQWTLATGVICWLVMYLLYSLEKPAWLVVSSMSLHGVAYVLFLIAGQIYINHIAPREIVGSAQALHFTAWAGFGLLIGTQITGVTMDKLRDGDKFKWRAIFLVPCAIMLACTIALVILFEG